MAGLAEKKTPWGNKPIDSVEVVLEALAYLDMPNPSKEAILLIASGSGKGKFKSAIEECLLLKGAAVQQETKRYLFGIVSCISGVMSDSLKHLGYENISHEMMIHIGTNHGMSFRGAVNASLTEKDPNHHQSMAIVHQTLQEASNVTGSTPIKSQNRPRPVEKQSAHDVHQPAAQAEMANESDQPIADNGDEDKGFLSTHVYGGKAALCFNAALSQNKKNHTVILDAALSIGERDYDWKNAIKIQLGHKELALLYGVLVGWKNSVKFDAHGAANDKGFEIARQDGKFFVKVYAKNESPRAVPMSAQDAYPVAMVILTQIIKQAPPELRGHPNLIIHMMKEMQFIQELPKA